MANKKNRKEEAEYTTEQASGSISDVVSAVLDVGVSLARTLAKATTGDMPLKEPKEEAGPLNAMVFYGVTAASNLANQLFSSFKATAERAPRAAQNMAPVSSSSATLPTVRQGATLRIPLSIENPSSAPMVDMKFICLSIRAEKQGDSHSLSNKAIRFEPKKLEVAPKDFEKLTVFIDIEVDTVPDVYEVTIGLVDGNFQMPLQFSVLPS
ncbi:MAG: hypothetical protein HUU08_15460 [Candidatus Brocadia sp.]|nr:hypothetical protein [Candidatus Brocadia sp.]